MTASLAARMPDVPPKSRAAHQPLRILWSGWITPNKALHLLLRAAAIAGREIPLEITVLGKGSEESANRKLAARLGIADRVQFRGWLPYHEALRCYEEAHCFAFTSLRDTTGTVLLEAMSRGAPPICLDHQGASEVVTVESGVKIPVTDPTRVTSDLSTALVDLYRNNSRLQSLSEGAKRRAAEFTWDAQGARMADIYRELIASRANELALRPDLTEELSRLPPKEEWSTAGLEESLR
jgi:glycosyltransferase involved in cell wall biosynthesis